MFSLISIAGDDQVQPLIDNNDQSQMVHHIPQDNQSEERERKLN